MCRICRNCFGTQNHNMCHDIIDSDPIEMQSQLDQSLNPNLIQIAVPYILPIGSGSGIGASLLFYSGPTSMLLKEYAMYHHTLGGCTVYYV
jgi:hypothetical protein